MGQIIRARQPVITRIFPHQGNTKYLVPNRHGMIPDQSPAFNTTGVIIEFGQPITGTTGNTGMTIYIDGVSVVVGLVTQPQPNFWSVSYPLATALDLASFEYDGSGDWAGANKFVVGMFGQAGAIK